MEQKIETPFKIKNSKLDGYEYPIPEGYEAKIKDGKIIIKKSENEDERIRKSLITLLQHFCKGYRVPGLDFPVSYKDMLAWLEKQGEQKPIDNLTPQEAMNIAVAKCFEQDEQKSADMVEPKFKVGDWIIHNKNIELANSIMLVTGKDNNAYLCKYINGQCSYNIEFIDKDYHLWTIQDAKDGDVLVSPNKDLGDWVGIFKSLEEEDSMTVYCYLSRDGKFVQERLLCDEKTTDNLYPATKEQRDLLFQKMKEAGYEWDAKKKELMKTKQKPQRMVSAETKEAMYDKPAWSEEDRIHLGNCIALIQRLSDSEANWLKSLKDRVQPKQEWSDEDEKMFEHIIEKATLTFSEWNRLSEKEINFLKSLRPQKQWKPSDEQLDTLLLVKGYILNHYSEDLAEKLSILYKQLKAL